jgi:streptomycin 6-kinase
MIPAPFARSTIEREGEAGEAWLAELPAIVDDLLIRWDCVLDGPPAHGHVGLVLPVRAAAGPAVLKVSFPHRSSAHEAKALATWGGRGAALLYEHDDARCAILLERARPSRLVDLDDGDEIATVAGQLCQRLSVPAPSGLPRLADLADSWADHLRAGAREFPGVLPASVVDSALAVVDELGRRQPDLLVHGDLHPRNILRGDREPWLAVDPTGWVGDPAYDGGTLFKPRAYALRGRDDLLGVLRRELDLFAEAAGLDRERVRRWVQLQLVQAAYWGRKTGFSVARGGSALKQLVAFVDELAVSWC